MPRSYINEFPDQPQSPPIDPVKLRFWAASSGPNFGTLRASNVIPAANIGNMGWLKAPTIVQVPGTLDGPANKIYCGLGAGNIANFGDNSGAGVKSMSISLRSVKRSFFRVSLNDGLWPGPLFEITSTGFLIKDSNGNYQEAQNANFTGAAPPVWNLVVGGNTIDGAVTWVNRGPNPDQRYWLGCFQNRAAVAAGAGTDAPLTQFCAFRFSKPAGDLNWQAICGNGAFQTVVDTKIPPLFSGASMLFEPIYTPTLVTFLINGNVVATIKLTLPAQNTLMENIVNVDNTGAIAGNAVGANMYFTGWEENQ